MGHFRCGDVILASVSISRSDVPKTRPAIILGSDGDGNLIACPVSHKPSFDSTSVPLSLDDFREGGLDLFSESYILVAHPVKIRSRDIKGKKGRLNEEFLIQIKPLVTETDQNVQQNGEKTKKRKNRGN
ncbi:MAG: type II toxin-antitoxin system PemK/MazF family toxin [Methanoregulaceae archaeon]